MARPMMAALLAFLMLSSSALSLAVLPGTAAAAEGGVSAAYRVTVTSPPDPVISVKATFNGLAGPLRLEVGFPQYSGHSVDSFKDLRLTSGDGQRLSPVRIDRRTIEVTSGTGSVVASYSVDLSKVWSRACKVDGIGGGFSGSEGLLVPANQPLTGATVAFDLPDPWQVVSVYPSSEGVFTVEPVSFKDLAVEVKAGGWYFGDVDFDQTVTYADGFPIRVVGFKGFPYEHWNAYLSTSPLEEALRTADFYHETYVRLKELYGEFPVDRLLVVGPGFWQAGSSWAAQQLVGGDRYEYIPHHLIHAYFDKYPARIEFGEAFYFSLREGYPTYAEGMMTRELAGTPVWSGMLYQRKFHYLRGMHFGNMEQNSRQYVLGFVTTFLMDKEIRNRTGGDKGIDDLMVSIWQQNKGPNPVQVSDEEVLAALQQLTGTDWHEFYRNNVQDTSRIDVSPLDALKPDFLVFLGAVSDRWYGGHPSAYFVNQELISTAGDFDMGVRLQQPFGVDPLLLKFVMRARELRDVSREHLTEEDIERAMSLVSGKNHSDFLEFYRNQGFTIDPLDISEYVRTFSYPGGGDSPDNAVRMTPRAVSLGQSTPVVLEIADPAFAAADSLSLQASVLDRPKGLSALSRLVTGEGVSFAGEWRATEATGYVANVLFYLPKTASDGKTHARFTLNLPQDSGLIRFILNAWTGQGQYQSWLGGFIGTRKVGFQDTITIPIARQVSVFVNGSRLRANVEPFQSGGRTFVPLRALGEALGAESIKWDESTGAVTLVLGGRTVVLGVGQETALVDGREVPMSAPAVKKGDHVFVPLRFVSEALGGRVDWFERTQTAWVTTAQEALGEAARPVYGPERVVSGDWVIDGEAVVVSADEPVYFQQAYHEEHKIIVKNGGTLKVLGSYIRSEHRYLIELYDTSTLIVENSRLIDEERYLSGAVIVNLDRSVVRAKDSRLDLVGIGSGNRPPSYTTVELSNSSVRQLEIDLFDMDPIVIEGLKPSTIEDYTLSSKTFSMTLRNVKVTNEIVSWIGDVDVTFRNVDYGQISPEAGSKVTLTGSTIREITPRITGYSGTISGLPSGSVSSFTLDLPPTQGPSFRIAESSISRGWYVRYWDSDIEFRNCRISLLRPMGRNHAAVYDSVIGQVSVWDTTGEMHFSGTPIGSAMVMNYPGQSNDIVLTGDISVKDKDWDKGLSHWGETVIRREFTFSPTAEPKHITTKDDKGAMVEDFALGDAPVKKILVFDRPERRFEVFVDGVLKATLVPFSDSPVFLP
ncbi:MAG: stalk domain-containing protein [Bacillota bacterium]